MKLPRDLSGRDLVAHLIRNWGYGKVHQVGSHIILETQAPSPQRIAVPDHSPLRVGTLNAILSAIASHKNVSKDAILRNL